MSGMSSSGVTKVSNSRRRGAISGVSKLNDCSGASVDECPEVVPSVDTPKDGIFSSETVVVVVTGGCTSEVWWSGVVVEGLAAAASACGV